MHNLKNKTVGVIGATGYAGLELVRFLLVHPDVTLHKISSVSFTGQPLSAVYPALYGICDMLCVDAPEVIESCDVIFAALPHGLSEETAKACMEKNKVFIDLGADFRLEDEATYEAWYGAPFAVPALHNKAVYGLPELNRAAIQETTLVANPGCYPTSVALGLMPVLTHGFIETSGLIVDSKSGVSGAGRGLSQNTHFPDCNEAFSAYKVASHRHTPEMEQTLSKMANTPVTLTFVPHLLPVNRGILSTIYASLKKEVTEAEVRALYEEVYAEEPFVRVLPAGVGVNISQVRGSNYCDIQIYIDTHTNGLIVTSVIDNMVKGAAGQAIQNMNIVCGFAETAGLTGIPTAF
ncbi:MAG: N-acetyl-gamma-glutamyl-phosphate reductase [Christensenellaceae bacterium]|jgi:N-acetyl-gamma-glutamyl-phosphate reductase